MDIYTPLSSTQIQNKVRCKFVLYENMHKIKNIEELLPKTLILYQLEKVGHFCCVFKNDEGIQFFDPLGIFPDDELHISSNIQTPNHNFAYLDNILIKSRLPVIYNDHQLQAHHTSTCGHWCTVRMFFSDLYCDVFADSFNDVKNKDELIVKIYESF